MENCSKQTGETISCWQTDTTLTKDRGWVMELWHRRAIDWALAGISKLVFGYISSVSELINLHLENCELDLSLSHQKSNVCFQNRFICYFGSIWSCFMMYVGISWDRKCNTNKTDQENCSSKRETRGKIGVFSSL